MRVRKARPEDLAAAVALAGRLGLDYPGMASDAVWVAEEGGAVAGLVVLKTQTDCLELCALGVDPGRREAGLGQALVEALMEEAPGDVHLATVIPGFFETCRFERTSDVPATFTARRKTDWCEGCSRKGCTVMVRRKP